MTIFTASRGVRSSRFCQRLRSTSFEPGVFRSTTRATRVSTSEMSNAPLVSSETLKPRSQSSLSSAAQRGCASGSPPVTQTYGVSWRRTSASISPNDRHSPPVNAYAVSQYWQRSGQPVSRTNTVGQPLNTASPWIEKKISVTLSRAAAGSCSAAAATATPLARQRRKPLRREPRGRRVRELPHHFLQRRARGVAIAELDLAIPDLQQRIGQLRGLRILLEHLAERRERVVELPAHVMRRAEPVLRVVRERDRRELHEKRLECPARLFVLARRDQIERRLIVLLVAARRPRRRCGGARSARRADSRRTQRWRRCRRRRLESARRRFERAQPLVDVDVELALTARTVLRFEAQRLELAAQRGRLAAQTLELVRKLDQALVLDDALDADQARLEILHAQRDGILARAQRAAAARYYRYAHG